MASFPKQLRLPVIMVSTLLLVLYAASLVMADDPYCKPKTPPANQKKMPRFGFGTFNVEYRATFVDKKYSMWAKEYFSYYRNRARLDVMKKGVFQSLLLDYENNTYIYYKYNEKERLTYTCKKEVLDRVDGDTFDLFGFRRYNGSSKHILPASEILQFGKDMGYVFVGQTKIDSLPVDHWQSCLTWKNVQAVFTVDYYVSVDTFTNGGYNRGSVPVRAEIQGTVGTGTTKKKIHHIYDFLNYDRAFDTEDFSLPEYMTCLGTDIIWKKKFPELPENVAYTTERVTRVKGSGNKDDTVKVELKTIYYDKTHQLIRHDQGRATSISDFNAGVEFVIVDSACSVRPINPTNVNAAVVDQNGFIKMADEFEIRLLKTDLQYSGQQSYRSSQVYAYTGYTDKGENMEVYVHKYPLVPVGIKVLNSKTSTTTYYNIFKFRNMSSPSDENVFEIRRCAMDDDFKDYHITFYPHPHWSDVDYDVAAQLLREKVAYVSGVSVLQITHNEFIHDPVLGEYHWHFSYLSLDKVSKVGAEDFMAKVNRVILNGKFLVTLKLNYGEQQLVGVNIMPGSIHDIVDYEEQQGRFVTIQSHCADMIDKGNMHSFKKSLDDCKQECIDKEPVCDSFQYTPKTKFCQIGKFSDAVLKQKTGCNFYTTAPIRHFNPMIGISLISLGDANFKEVKTPGECAKMCLDEKSFQCESFDVCGDSTPKSSKMRCYMHKTHFFDGSSIPTQKNQECNHHYRRYSDDYSVTDKTEIKYPGQTSAISPSPEQCAYQCKKYEHGCSSFSYCYGSDGTQSCSILPVAKKGEATYKTKEFCYTYTSKGIVNQQIAMAIGESAVRGDAGYSGTSMLILALSMIIAGIGLGALAVFLLRRFQVWKGFQ